MKYEDKKGKCFLKKIIKLNKIMRAWQHGSEKCFLLSNVMTTRHTLMTSNSKYLKTSFVMQYQVHFESFTDWNLPPTGNGGNVIFVC